MCITVGLSTFPEFDKLLQIWLIKVKKEVDGYKTVNLRIALIRCTVIRMINACVKKGYKLALMPLLVLFSLVANIFRLIINHTKIAE